jgi:hypothetical protein
MEGKGRVPPKPKPHDKEVIRRVEKPCPGAKATEPTFDAVIEAILNAYPEAIRERQDVRRRARQRTDKQPQSAYKDNRTRDNDSEV